VDVMTKAEKKKKVERLIARYQALSAQLDKVTEIFGPSGYESDFFVAVFGPMNDLLDVTAEMVGDKAGWISWFICDNECGKRGMSAGPKGKMRRIKTVADLMRLINAG